MPRPYNRNDLNSITQKTSGNLSTHQVSEKSIFHKHSEFDLIIRAERDNRVNLKRDVQFWLTDSSDNYLGENPIRISQELKISPLDASKLFKKKLSEEKSFHEGIVKVIDNKLAHIESIYDDDKLKCEEMRVKYEKGENLQVFHNHILDCEGCYRFFIKRAVNLNGKFTQEVLTEIQIQKKQRSLEKRKLDHQKWLEARKEGETIK